MPTFGVQQGHVQPKSAIPGRMAYLEEGLFVCCEESRRVVYHRDGQLNREHANVHGNPSNQPTRFSKDLSNLEIQGSKAILV
eukprot:16864_5